MKLKNKSILVTGGAGFIGSHLVDQLINEAPEKIVVIDNFFLGTMENLEDAIKNFDEIKIYREDAAGYTAMENILAKESIDVIFDLAVKPLPYSFLDPEGAYMVSVNIAHVLVSLLRKELYATLIHISSSEAYGTAEYVPMDESHPLNPTTPYAAGKASADLLIMSYYRTFGLDISIIRPFNNYGPRQNENIYAAIIPTTIRRILQGKKPILEWDGKQARDFIFVKDTAKAVVSIYNHKNTRGKIINIASGKEIAIETLLQSMMHNLNYTGEMIRKPKRPADVRRHCADISLASKLIGFSPETSFETGIREAIDWHLKRMQDK